MNRPQVPQVPQIDPKDKQKFHKALLALHGDMETLKKSESNPFFKSKYVALPAMLEAIKPVAQKHGFILSQYTDVTQSQGGIVNVVFSSLVHAETGISEVAKLAIDTDMIKEKTMQGLGGAITYARRYTLSSLLALQEEDDDGNRASGKKPKKGVSAGSML